MIPIKKSLDEYDNEIDLDIYYNAIENYIVRNKNVMIFISSYFISEKSVFRNNNDNRKIDIFSKKLTCLKNKYSSIYHIMDGKQKIEKLNYLLLKILKKAVI